MHQLLTKAGFVKLEQFRLDPQGKVQKEGIVAVYGKIIQPGITLRVVEKVVDEAYKHKYVLYFVERNLDKVRELHSVRLVPTNQDLKLALDEWPKQFARENILCNKCFGTGIYRIQCRRKKVNVDCNRCNGKGWQNYNEQIANERYDAAMRKQGQTSDDKPNWRPY